MAPREAKAGVVSAGWGRLSAAKRKWGVHGALKFPTVSPCFLPDIDEIAYSFFYPRPAELKMTFPSRIRTMRANPMPEISGVFKAPNFPRFNGAALR